jgi:hypothetical protein
MVRILTEVLADLYHARVLRAALRLHRHRARLGFRSPRRWRAERRAEDLLQRHLTPEQRKTLRQHGWFRVRGQDGSVWTVRRSILTTNVTRTAPDGTSHTYCSYLRDAPNADTLLVQKLYIEATGGRGLPLSPDGVVVQDRHLFTRGR